jgi:hypothetical protein
MSLTFTIVEIGIDRAPGGRRVQQACKLLKFPINPHPLGSKRAQVGALVCFPYASQLGEGIFHKAQHSECFSDRPAGWRARDHRL